MRLIAHLFGYKFYVGITEKGTIYNVIPENEYPANNPPLAGYYSSQYICTAKNVPNLFYEY